MSVITQRHGIAQQDDTSEKMLQYSTKKCAVQQEEKKNDQIETVKTVV